jgi:carbon monoxide dehydrogenase subunit G
MLRIKGEELFDQAPEILWGSLSRPEFLCRCFPGVDRVIRSDDRSAAVIVRPGFSFVRGTLEVSFEFAETDPPRFARVRIHIKGIGSSAELESTLNFEAAKAGTKIDWAVNALQIGGLLKAVSQGLIQAAAQKVSADTWAEIRNNIRGEGER